MTKSKKLLAGAVALGILSVGYGLTIYKSNKPIDACCASHNNQEPSSPELTSNTNPPQNPNITKNDANNPSLPPGHPDISKMLPKGHPDISGMTMLPADKAAQCPFMKSESKKGNKT